MAETEQLRKIFVGGLNWATDEDTMKNYFSHWGNIVDCVVMRTHDKTSRGFGFVTFDKAKCVDECLKERKHELDGRQIEPKRAVPRDETNNPSAHQKTKKIFIGGLASTTTEEDIEEYFNKLLHEFGEGRIVDIDLKRDRDNPKRIRGFAYVTFDSEEVVEKILIMKTHEIKMKHCEVKRAETQAAIRKKQERDGVRPTVHSSSSRENSRSGPATNSMNMAQNMQGFGMGNWNPGMLAGFFGGLGSGERGSGRPDMDGVNRGGAKSGGGGWGNADVSAGGNWGGAFGSNFNPGAMGFGGFGPGFGGFGPGFGFNPFAQLASMGYGAGAFGPGFGFGFGGGGFGPSAGSGDRGSSGGDSSRNVARGSADYGNDSNHDGKGVDSGTRDRSSAYPSITGYSNMIGQNWPVSYPGMAAAATVAAAAAAGGGNGGAVGDLKGASGTGTNHADAYPMGAYGQMNSSYGPSRTSGTWSVGSDSTNSNRMYKPY